MSVGRISYWASPKLSREGRFAHVHRGGVPRALMAGSGFFLAEIVEFVGVWSTILRFPEVVEGKAGLPMYVGAGFRASLSGFRGAGFSELMESGHAPESLRRTCDRVLEKASSRCFPFAKEDEVSRWGDVGARKTSSRKPFLENFPWAPPYQHFSERRSASEFFFFAIDKARNVSAKWPQATMSNAMTSKAPSTEKTKWKL